MAVLLTGRTNSVIQLFTVLLVFILVLVMTGLTTKWLANYQKQQSVNCNVEVIEMTRVANNKYVQIVRVGEKYLAMAVCKDTVTFLCELPSEQIKTATPTGAGFKELLDKVMKKEASDTPDEPKE